MTQVTLTIEELESKAIAAAIEAESAMIAVNDAKRARREASRLEAERKLREKVELLKAENAYASESTRSWVAMNETGNSFTLEIFDGDVYEAEATLSVDDTRKLRDYLNSLNLG